MGRGSGAGGRCPLPTAPQVPTQSGRAPHCEGVDEGLRKPKAARGARRAVRCGAHLPQHGAEVLLAPAASVPQRLQHTRPVTERPPAAATGYGSGARPPPLPVRGRGGAASRPGTERAGRNAPRRCCPRRNRRRPGTGGPRTCFPPAQRRRRAPGPSAKGSAAQREQRCRRGRRGWGSVGQFLARRQTRAGGTRAESPAVGCVFGEAISVAPPLRRPGAMPLPCTLPSAPPQPRARSGTFVRSVPAPRR